MKRILLSILTMLTLCFGLSVGYKTSPTDHDITFVTNTARPALPVSPMPVYAPQLGAMEESVPMETIDIVFVGILFVVGVLVWALVRSNFITANLIPSDLVKEIVKVAVSTVLDAVDARAKSTVDNTADDEMAAMVRREVTAALQQAGITINAPPPAVG